jgi:hypothetical protein
LEIAMLQIATIIVGIVAIVMGIKAFTPGGIKLSPKKRLEGEAAVVAGLLTLAGGIAMILFALFIWPMLL